METQGKFWAEAVSCAAYLQDLTITAGRECALELWSGTNVQILYTKLIEFGRLGVATKKKKLKSKMDERGFKVVMVGYASNHAVGVYRLYNPQTNRIIMSRDVKWSTFNRKQLHDGMELFEAGIGAEQPLNEYVSREKTYETIEEEEDKEQASEEEESLNSSISSGSEFKIEEIKISSNSESEFSTQTSKPEQNINYTRFTHDTRKKYIFADDDKAEDYKPEECPAKLYIKSKWKPKRKPKPERKPKPKPK